MAATRTLDELRHHSAIVPFLFGDLGNPSAPPIRRAFSDFPPTHLSAYSPGSTPVNQRPSRKGTERGQESPATDSPSVVSLSAVTALSPREAWFQHQLIAALRTLGLDLTSIHEFLDGLVRGLRRYAAGERGLIVVATTDGYQRPSLVRSGTEEYSYLAEAVTRPTTIPYCPIDASVDQAYRSAIHAGAGRLTLADSIEVGCQLYQKTSELARTIDRATVTYADIESLPDGVRAEVISGEVVLFQPGNPSHSYASDAVIEQIRGPFHRGNGGPGGWWIASTPDVVWDDPELPSVIPDIAGWRRNRMPEQFHQWKQLPVPDWTCEIISRSTGSKDRGIKKEAYARHNVGHYWIIDPTQKTLQAFRNASGLWQEIGYFKGSDRAAIEPFSAVEFDVGLLWR